MAKNSVTPVLEAYAKELKDYVNQKEWWRSYCPICGSKPIIGELQEKEGKRFLLCSSCGFKWRFKRMVCPFCHLDIIAQKEGYKREVPNILNV